MSDKEKICVHCGKSMPFGERMCPSCGEEQPIRWLLYFTYFLLAVFVIGALYRLL